MESSGPSLVNLGFADDLGEDDYDEEGEQRGLLQSRDGLVFVIDCSKEMFECTTEENESYFQLCIKCARNSLMKMVVSNTRDVVGVLFYATSKDNNENGFKNIYMLHALDQPSASSILDLESYMEMDSEAFNTQLGHSTTFSLSEVFWSCSNMFSSFSKSLGSRRVFLFTNNDDPYQHSEQSELQAKTKAADLRESGVELELMHLKNKQGQFDITKFYQELVFSYEDDDSASWPDPADKFDELLTRTRYKDVKKRSLGKIPFQIGEGFALSVNIYSLIQQARKPSAVKLDRRSNEQLQSKRRFLSKGTEAVLMPDEIKYAQTFGKRRIEFDNSELKEMKSFANTGLHLMGFKPSSSLKYYHHIKPAKFIYPDEYSVTGSTKLFSALLQRCLERDVMPFCRLISRKNSPPDFVALLPQREEFDDQNIQIAPSGFHIVYLPFADDIRNIDKPDQQPTVGMESVDQAKLIIKNLKFKFNPESFENPFLQTHYRNVEAFALDRDEPEQCEDYTVPDTEMMMKRAGPLIHDFKDLVAPQGFTTGAPKRKPAASAEGRVAKKPNMELVDVEQCARDGSLSKFTVPVLKELCKQKGIKTSGTKKNDFITAINKNFGI